MLTFVINLAHRTDRMALIDTQLRALNMPYERIDAVNGMGNDNMNDLALIWVSVVFLVVINIHSDPICLA